MVASVNTLTLSLAALIASHACCTVNAAASKTFANVVSFGDSFSDNGNGTFKLTNGMAPPAPYKNGRWSNGPTWVEYLSDTFGAALTDYAYGGAVANLSDIPDAAKNNIKGVPDLDGQLGLFKQAGVMYDPETTLYTVFAGGNDYIDSLSGAATPDIAKIVTAFTTFLGELISATSARQIVILNIPPFEQIPFVVSQVPSAYIPLVATIAPSHNTALEAGIKTLTSTFTNTTIYLGDLNKMVNYLVTPTGMKSSGFTNVKEGCFNKTSGAVCDTPDNYLFWDGLHPTTAAHKLLGKIASDEVMGNDDLATVSIVTGAPTGTATNTATVSPTATASKSGAVGSGLRGWVFEMVAVAVVAVMLA
ncbi:hypothetical protein HDU76_001152 [Blyttiomyces sp. JEL0837]|nr:hypothetical protein HDU76_001152 [Blyttiomyces sp. JEL0837]